MSDVFGVEVSALPDGCQPIEVLAIVKALDEHGKNCMYVTYSQGLMPWDRVGLLTVALHRTSDEAQDTFETEYDPLDELLDPPEWDDQ